MVTSKETAEESERLYIQYLEQFFPRPPAFEQGSLYLVSFFNKALQVT